MLTQPFTDIAVVTPGSNKPWRQDPVDQRFFWIKLRQAWNNTLIILEKNPSGEYQELPFDADFMVKLKSGRFSDFVEDSIGVSADGMFLWRFSTDTSETSELVYADRYPALIGSDSEQRDYIIYDSNNVDLTY
ncbi:MAG: hypothetical protein WA919_00805 [Coleofasciculaceae cyanobacterium]